MKIGICCVICKAKVSDGTAVFRINKLNEPAVWACYKHHQELNGEPIHPETLKLMGIK
jgi:hypothetical protein